MTQKFTVLIEQDEDKWYVSEVMELPGCHTQAKNLDQLMVRTKEAIQAYLTTPKENKPLLFSEKFIGLQQIEV